MNSESSVTSARPGAWSIVTLVAVAACVIGACWAWSCSSPSLGERSFSAARVGAAWAATAAFWAAGHAILFGLAIPALYRPRPTYTGLAGFCGLIGLLAGITAVALFAAA